MGLKFKKTFTRVVLTQPDGFKDGKVVKGEDIIVFMKSIGYEDVGKLDKMAMEVRNADGTIDIDKVEPLHFLNIEILTKIIVKEDGTDEDHDDIVALIDHINDQQRNTLLDAARGVVRDTEKKN